MGGVDDPRWRRLMDEGTRCSSCNQIHRGIVDLGWSAPYYWTGDPKPQDSSTIVDHGNFLTEDFCVTNYEHFYVRCLLPLRVIGTAQTFSYGVWSSLAMVHFQKYFASFRDDDQGKLGPWFGWFANRLKGYPDTLNLKCQVRPQDGNNRPFLELEPGDHPLSHEQRDGVSVDRLLEIYRLNGHDLG